MNVFEELTEDTVDRVYVERRIEDWRGRIAELYRDVVSWLPRNWSAHKDGEVSTREELMQKFDMPEERLPVLRIEAEDGRRGRLEPRGLWIIGANGRIDLILPDRHYLIINREDSFEPSDWQIAPLTARLQQRPFDRRTLQDVLA